MFPLLQGDIVLLGLREYQDEKADVIMKFTADEARVLKQYGELPEHIRCAHAHIHAHTHCVCAHTYTLASNTQFPQHASQTCFPVEPFPSTAQQQLRDDLRVLASRVVHRVPKLFG